jgi:hypothetical protein
LGLRIESDQLVVTLQNLDAEDLSVLAGMNTAHGRAYGFAFTAHHPTGTQRKVWDMRPESNEPSAGLLLPQVAQLARGEKSEFAFPLASLDYWDKKGAVVLPSLLAKGYTLEVSLAVSPDQLEKAQMGGMPRPATGKLWIGKLSDTLRLNAGG